MTRNSNCVKYSYSTWKICQIIWLMIYRNQGPDSIYGCHLTIIGNSIVEIRRSWFSLISTMGFPILVRRHLYIDSTPRTKCRLLWEIIILSFQNQHQASMHIFCKKKKTLIINTFTNKCNSVKLHQNIAEKAVCICYAMHYSSSHLTLRFPHHNAVLYLAARQWWLVFDWVAGL